MGCATLFYSTQLLWPRCAAPTFLHFLLTAGQQWVVQQYCRLLATWCDWHCHARQFLLASALLNSGEPEKACDLFLSAAGGVPSDEFLTQHLLQLQGDTSDDLAIAYYLKVKRHEEMRLQITKMITGDLATGAVRLPGSGAHRGGDRTGSRSPGIAAAVCFHVKHPFLVCRGISSGQPSPTSFSPST